MFTPVVDKAVDDLLLESDWDTYIKDNLNKGVVRPIAEATLGAPASTIDITSIAADWSHLLLGLYARGDTAATAVNALLRFNGDSGANYDSQHAQGIAGTAAAAETIAGTSVDLMSVPAASATANFFGTYLVFIPHYAQATSHKLVVAVGGRKTANSTGNLLARLITGYWRNANAITQVTLLPSAGNFIAGTRATLYGMGGV